MPDLVDSTTWLQLLLFCVGVYFLVLGIRRLVEGLAPKLKVNYYWTEVALPAMPLAFGMLGSLLYPFPGSWFTALTVRQVITLKLTLGLSGGALSGKAYRVVTAVIKRVTGVDIDSVDTPVLPAKPLDAKEPPKAA